MSLQITEPPNASLLEHSALEIPYTVTLAPGVGGAASLIDLVVCGADALEGGQCDIYDQVRPTWTSPAGSKLRVRAPLGGPSVNMSVVVCRKNVSSDQVVSCGAKLDDKSFTRTVSARFMVSLDSFTILSMRSTQGDTVYMALEGMFNQEHRELVGSLGSCDNVLGNPTFEKPILCKGPTRYGMKDIGHGAYPVPHMNVGEFEIIPRNWGHLRFGFVLFNYGFVVHPEILTGDMAGNVRGTISGKLFDVGDVAPERDFTHELDGSPWLGCDGPTAGGAVSILNDETPDSLDAVTRDTGAFSKETKIYSVDSQVGCGNSPRYTLHWTVHRTSW